MSVSIESRGPRSSGSTRHLLTLSRSGRLPVFAWEPWDYRRPTANPYPLKSIAVPNIGTMQPRGLTVVIGPNSSGKTQFLKDIQARLLGQSRKLVVCEKIDLERPPALDPLIDSLCSMRQIRKKVDEHNRPIIEALDK